MSIIGLTIQSLLNRRLTALLTIFSIAISVLLLLGVERVRVEARKSFTNTLSGTDLIVGARTGDINLLLSSAFHIGNASSNVTWESYSEVSQHPSVEWTIPISLGDSHRGYRVMGTNSDLFKHYRYRGNTPLVINDGKPAIPAAHLLKPDSRDCPVRLLFRPSDIELNYQPGNKQVQNTG